MSLRSMRNDKVEGLSRVDGYRVQINLIHEQEGFNARDYSAPRVQEQIRHYADIYKAAAEKAEANPQLKLNPGDAMGPWEVRSVIVDGVKTIFATDGHLRRRGALLAIEEGAKIDSVTVFEDKSASLAESIARTVTSQDGLKLMPLEVARVYHRLMTNHDLTESDIAELVTKTTVHVQQNLKLLELPEAVQAMIDAGKVAANTARELVDKHGAENAIRILAVGEELLEGTDKKITPKVIEAAKNKDEQSGKPVARKPAQRVSKLLYNALREHTMSLTDRVWSQIPAQLDDTQDNVEVTLSFSRDELAKLKEIRDLASAQEKEEQGDPSEEQMDMLNDGHDVPERWQPFAEELGVDKGIFLADVKERFERVTENHDLLDLDKPLDEATKTILWERLVEKSAKAELTNIRLMRSFVKLTMGDNG